MINTKNFDPNLLNIEKISFKSSDTVIYNIRYLIFNNVDGYIV